MFTSAVGATSDIARRKTSVPAAKFSRLIRGQTIAPRLLRWWFFTGRVVSSRRVFVSRPLPHGRGGGTKRLWCTFFLLSRGKGSPLTPVGGALVRISAPRSRVRVRKSRGEICAPSASAAHANDSTTPTSSLQLFHAPCRESELKKREDFPRWHRCKIAGRRT